MACGILPDQGWNPCPLTGGFLTTVSPGKPQGQGFYKNYLEFCCTGDLSALLFIYSVTYLCQYGFKGICFVLWVLIHTVSFFFFFKLWPLGALSVGSYVPLTCPHCFDFWALSFWHCKLLQAHPVYSLPWPQNKPFLRVLDSFHWRMGLETKICALGVPIGTEVSWFLDLSLDRAR